MLGEVRTGKGRKKLQCKKNPTKPVSSQAFKAIHVFIMCKEYIPETVFLVPFHLEYFFTSVQIFTITVNITNR